MVQIIPARRSFGAEFGQQFSKGATEGYFSAKEKAAENKQREEENETIQKLTGLDMSGIRDPKVRSKAYQMAQEANQKNMQMQQEQQFLNQILGGQPGNPQQDMGNAMSKGEQQGSPNQEQKPFDISQVSDEDIVRATAMNPKIGNAARAAKDSALREKTNREKLELAKLKASPEYQRQQHLQSAQAQSDVKYNQELQETSKQHELKAQTLNRLEQLNKKGVTGKPYEKALEKIGLVNLTSDGRREFAADVKNLITDIRSILGGQFSNFEFQTILNAYPSADFSKGANEAIIRNLKAFQDIKTKEVQFANQIKKENKGKLPEDFQSKVNDMVREYAHSKTPEIKENARVLMNEEYGIQPGNTLMFDPQGEPLNVADSDIARYLELGASLP